jgi:hypothetical protein
MLSGGSVKQIFLSPLVCPLCPAKESNFRREFRLLVFEECGQVRGNVAQESVCRFFVWIKKLECEKAVFQLKNLKMHKDN